MKTGTRRVMRTALYFVLSAAMAFTLAGCTFGTPSLDVTFQPTTVTVRQSTPIDGTVTFILNGWGSFAVSKVHLDYYDEYGNQIICDQMPSEVPLDQTIPLCGGLGVVAKSYRFNDLVSSDQLIPPDEMFYPLAPRPKEMKITFLDPAGKLVGGGRVGLEWVLIQS